jgi:hypothetical protein
MEQRPAAVLGVDFGGVINDGASHPSGDDTAFLSGGYEAAMATPVMAGAIDALKRLSVVLDGRIWVVSKCGPRIQQRTEQWLEHHRFFERTGIDATHIRFCRQRPEKANHCAELSVTHFVDDRGDVLGHLDGIVEHLYLFGGRAKGDWPRFERVASWDEAEPAIRQTVSPMGTIID